MSESKTCFVLGQNVWIVSTCENYYTIMAGVVQHVCETTSRVEVVVRSEHGGEYVYFFETNQKFRGVFHDKGDAIMQARFENSKLITKLERVNRYLIDLK